MTEPALPGSTLARLLAGRRAPKVFAIGFNKTGTTSLHRIFEGLGYRSYHGTKWRETSRVLIHLLHDAFCDGVPDDFRRLDARFPNAKFILQVRDLDAWLDSRLEHIHRLPPGKDRGPEWSATPEAVAAWVRKWNAYHVEVLSHFRDRPGDLLLINFIRDAGAAARIAAFLGHAAAVDKPHANRNPGAGDTLRNAAMIAEVLAGLGIPEAEWKNDIHCPALSGPAAAGILADTGAGSGLGPG
jgi:hypothetical protein